MTTDIQSILPSLRAPRSGDMGWIVQRHGELYFNEYGWDQRFEAIVAEVVADFMRGHQSSRERCWIAENHLGERLGSIMLVAGIGTASKLRLFLVEPFARGLGVGRLLLEAAIGFARNAGYSKVVLWTESCLSAARHLYGEYGFRLTSSTRHSNFGIPSEAETWQLDLLSDVDVGKVPGQPIASKSP